MPSEMWIAADARCGQQGAQFFLGDPRRQDLAGVVGGHDGVPYRHWTQNELAVSLEQVRANLDRYGLLDDQVQFLKGWFKDTLPEAPIERLAVARLDGDMYESTMTAIEAVYPKLQPGGFLIVDVYGTVIGCKQAIEDYRALQHQRADGDHRLDWGLLAQALRRWVLYALPHLHSRC
jgi:hypothetical protein